MGGTDPMEVGNQANSFGFSDPPVDEYRYWDDVVTGDAYISPPVPPP